MQINLNNPSELTLENVAKLLASKDDSEHRQLRVSKNGVAFLSDEVGNINTDGLATRFETWCVNNGYCGEEAAKDEGWVKKVHKMLSEVWPNPKSTFTD